VLDARDRQGAFRHPHRRIAANLTGLLAKKNVFHVLFLSRT
jgi:hypothetical protein